MSLEDLNFHFVSAIPRSNPLNYKPKPRLELNQCNRLTGGCSNQLATRKSNK